MGRLKGQKDGAWVRWWLELDLDQGFFFLELFLSFSIDSRWSSGLSLPMAIGLHWTTLAVDYPRTPQFEVFVAFSVRC